MLEVKKSITLEFNLNSSVDILNEWILGEELKIQVTCLHFYS